MSDWRTRAVIEAFCVFREKSYPLGKATMVPRPQLRGDGWPDTYHMVDIIIPGESDVTETHIHGLDALEILLDRLSLLTYAPSRLVKVVSTAPADVTVGEEFEMVTHDLRVEFDSPVLAPEDLRPFEEHLPDSAIHEATHHVRRALSDDSAEQHLLHLHIAVERIALQETEERIKQTCPSCNHEWEGPPASRRAVRGLLSEHSVARKDSDDAIQYRGKIAHGGGRRDLHFVNRATELAGSIESAALEIVAERSGIKVHRRVGVVVGPPTTRHIAFKESDGSFALVSTTWVAPIRFPQLKDEVCAAQGSVSAGMPTNQDGTPIIDPAAWPS